MNRNGQSIFPFLSDYLGQKRWQTSDNLLWTNKQVAINWQKKIDKAQAAVQKSFAAPLASGQ